VAQRCCDPPGNTTLAMTTDRIRRFIVEELSWQGEELTDDFPLLENQVIDSLGLFRIVGFLETEYECRFPTINSCPTTSPR
jgi:acyl carrier protein